MDRPTTKTQLASCKYAQGKGEFEGHYDSNALTNSCHFKFVRIFSVNLDFFMGEYTVSAVYIARKTICPKATHISSARDKFARSPFVIK